MPRLQITRVALVLCLAMAAGGNLRAGPPYLTDDPVPVDFHSWEFIFFATGDQSPGENSVAAPAFELNYGAAPDLHLHFGATVADVSEGGTGWKSGIGDSEFGIKYRLVDETESRPQLSFYPAVELPTGDGARDLGNGRTWYRLPVWLQKSSGAWTIDGGGGVALNPAPGQSNYGFLGCCLQRDMGKFLTLGAEVFWQGPGQPDRRGFTVLNAGGTLKFTDALSLLFSGGRSIAGDRQVVWYLGLDWTWGPPVNGK